MKTIEIPTPEIFNYELCYQFLQRSPRELLHRCDEGSVYKLLPFGASGTLVKVTDGNENLRVTFLNAAPDEKILAESITYIQEWFDLATDLTAFYTMAGRDKILKPLVKKYHGYRIIGQPDLFESLVWAVIGQQINLSFAYTIKARFVEKFGTQQKWNEHVHFAFPQPEHVARLTDDDLLPLQFSRQKSKYVVAIAEAFASASVSKQKLSTLTLEEAKNELMKIKGVGNWTANYALMKTFRHPDAFPLEDAGLHNALRQSLKLEAKPSLDEIRKIFKRYKGWEAYATLYLWKSL